MNISHMRCCITCESLEGDVKHLQNLGYVTLLLLFFHIIEIVQREPTPPRYTYQDEIKTTTEDFNFRIDAKPGFYEKK